MIIYNVTVNIDNSVEQDWLDWMQKVHIPDVMKTGYFLEYTLSEIMAETEGGTSYSIQYLCNSMQDFEEYQKTKAPQLQKEHTERYANKFGAFRTLLNVVKKG